MLRANSGITSSDEAFWLIPAIRRNERNGPGIVTVAVSGCDCAVGLSCAGVAAEEEENSERPMQRSANANKRLQERGDFIMSPPTFETRSAETLYSKSYDDLLRERFGSLNSNT
jgi:hypothetical protein